MIQPYLASIGLKEISQKVLTYPLNNFVHDAFQENKNDFTDEEVNSLYIYDIPKLSSDGSCSILEEKMRFPIIWPEHTVCLRIFLN